MRRCCFSDSVPLRGALLALLAVGCGHAISVPDWHTVGTAGTGNTSTGGGSGVTVELVKDVTNETGTGGAPNTGACDNSVAMPFEATLPGYKSERSPEVASVLSGLNSVDPQGKFKQMYGVPDPDDRGGPAYGNIEQSLDVELSSGKTLRGLKYRDAGRGVCLEARQPNNRPTKNHDYATAYPTASTRAASWDLDLEMRVGEAIGDETMASLNNMMLAPCMNILRHPYWGRSQETYGEDMYQVGRMASALTVGIQQHVIACAKHYAANNVENGRQNQNAVMNEQTLREAYLQHFEMVVKQAGVGSVMAAYNKINGTKCTQNKHLLRDILKDDWGFRGFVISDWWAMPGGDAHTTDTSLATTQTIEAVEAGMDLEVPWSLHYAYLGAAVNQGLSMDLINDAVGRILEQKFRFNTAYSDSPWGLNGPADTTLGSGDFSDSIINNQKHLELAEEAEIKSAVLLKNGTGDTALLPINNSPTSIAVVGIERKIDIATSTNLQPGDDGILKFATEINTGDRGSSRVNSDPAQSIGPFEGIQMAAVQHGIAKEQVTSGNTVDAAKNADLVVVVVGLTAGDEGEEYSVRSFGDRADLNLPGDQANFVSQVLDLQKPTVIFIESGSIVNVPWLSHSNKKQATIWAGYSGNHGGVAYGKLMFGDANFSGKLAVSWPKEPDMNRLLPFRDSADAVNMGYFFGYRLYDQHKDVALEFPFGYGLSYTTFKYSNLVIPCGNAKKTDVVYVTADVENTGSVVGDETMMLFVAGPPKSSDIKGERPVKELKRFQRVNGIQPAGQPKSRFRVTLPIAIQDLRHWEGEADGRWVVDSGDYTIYVAPNADVTNADGSLKNGVLKGTLTVHD